MLRAVVCCICLFWGCDLESGSRGDECTRSTQCSVGLACVDGMCDDDLTAIAEQSEVPELTAAPEAGVDAADRGSDAGGSDAASATAADAAALVDGGDGG